MPGVSLKNKINYTLSTLHKHICTVNMPHSDRVSKYARSYGGGVFSGIIFFFTRSESKPKIL